MMFRVALLLAASAPFLVGLSHGAETTAQDTQSPLKAEIVDCATVTPAAQIALIDYGFDPPAIKIPAGAVIKWVNKGDTSHIVKSGSPEEAGAGSLFDTSFIIVRSSRCIKFLTPGTYNYFCRIHSKAMRDGQVIVE